jgi:hypothetical protein
MIALQLLHLMFLMATRLFLFSICLMFIIPIFMVYLFKNESRNYMRDNPQHDM